ncbi:amidase1 [Zea mays]|uniref:Amidase1 n=1 Tax=Zea mays TaxID=4577 RepID=A0A1D6EQT4_MAIZE|nr:amidase1 [Zea mays]
MSSSAFGDFGPLTERRRAEKARQQRRRIMIAVGTVSIIAILIVIGWYAVMYSGKKSSSDGDHNHKSSSSPAKGKSSGGSDSESEAETETETESGSDSKTDLKAVSKSIKAMCSQTDYTDAAAVFQNCILVLRRPMDNQQNIVTAQGRADAREATGFVLQKCEFQAEAGLHRQGRVPALERRLRAQDAVVRRVRQHRARRQHGGARQLAGLQEGDQQGGRDQVHGRELPARSALDRSHRHAGEVRSVHMSARGSDRMMHLSLFTMWGIGGGWRGGTTIVGCRSRRQGDREHCIQEWKTILSSFNSRWYVYWLLCEFCTCTFILRLSLSIAD